jgi:hypothetical protein
VASVLAALVEVRTSGPSSDGWYFFSAGHDLLSSHGLHIYASNGLQAGPIQLAGFGGFGYLTSWLHLPQDATYAVVSTLGSTALIVAGTRLVRRHAGLSDSPIAELVIGGLAVGWPIATEVYTSGHPAELVIPALWVAAAALAQRGRSGWAGVLIGIGAGFETWAVLGIPVLLAGDGWRGRGKGLATAGVVSAGLYLPFVIAGPFRMGQVHWGVARSSLVHAVDPNLTVFVWSDRLAQAAVVVALGAVTAVAVRRSSAPDAVVWLVPAVIALAKAISEASGYDWYWLPAQVALLAGLACGDGLPRRVLAVVAGCELVIVTSSLREWPIALVGLVGVLVVSWLPLDRPRTRRMGTLRSMA